MTTNAAIKVSGLNKKFKSGYGIENIDFLVQPGKVFGYLGPNGAGKSTTIRTIMGFIKPDSGKSIISDLNKRTTIEELVNYDSWVDGNKIQKIIGYVPGEIAFPEFMTGIELLKMVFKLRNMTNWEDVKKHIFYWEFDPNLKIKKMSKGMKQKLALCIAWMHNPDIIILDEPTTGLDPLMQEKFIALVKQSKENGKAIIMSSHIFSEVEKTCDDVAIIKRGKIISTVNINDIKYNEEKIYEIKFKDKILPEFLSSKLFTLNEQNEKTNTVIVGVKNENINAFIGLLTKQNLEFFKEHPLDLEAYFMKYYQNEIKTEIVEKIENFSSGAAVKESKISFELIKHSTKKALGLWIFQSALLLLITGIALITLKFNLGSAIGSTNPEDVKNVTQGVGILTSMIIGQMGYLLVVIYVLVCSTSLVATEVERGTMVNLLTTNQSRKSVVLTKMFSFITMVLTTIVVEILLTVILIASLGLTSYVNFGVLTIGLLGLFLILFLMAGIGFFFSTLFNKAALSLSATGAIIIVSWIFSQVSQIDSVSFLKYLSINTLYSFSSITSVSDLSSYLAQYLVLGCGGIGFFISSYFVFTKKDLPL